MSIFLTGSTGFVGKNFIKYFIDYYEIRCHQRDSDIVIGEKVVIHCAGKAHDLEEKSSYRHYHEVNTQLTMDVFDKFLESDAEVFIFLSSVKAVSDKLDRVLTEDEIPDPKTHYGKSKLLAENYIKSKIETQNKRIFILRPCMIHGPGNKGNLSLLYKVVTLRAPWLLGAFVNQRSFCSIGNLLFIVRELVENKKIVSGVYNISDDSALSTNQVIRLISESLERRIWIVKIPRVIIRLIAFLGNFFRLPLNSHRLRKLTESYVVSNDKIKGAIGKELPINSKAGLLETFNSFKK
ncbi:NAD-dependent epimerase/dehydratase family protein [Akkermansiaceae bacterium]|nr:NAD-dependent epimerase/dehydratase family protein [Akkermansiaceae bacterium]